VGERVTGPTIGRAAQEGDQKNEATKEGDKHEGQEGSHEAQADVKEWGEDRERKHFFRAIEDRKCTRMRHVAICYKHIGSADKVYKGIWLERHSIHKFVNTFPKPYVK
jgi:hypothetical protein